VRTSWKRRRKDENGHPGFRSRADHRSTLYLWELERGRGKRERDELTISEVETLARGLTRFHILNGASGGEKLLSKNIHRRICFLLQYLSGAI